MISTAQIRDPFPGDPLGQRLCRIFGQYLWCAIEAAAPEEAADAPEWNTITGYPLRPRVLWNLWQDAQSLVGVRFGPETRYALLDIDAGSEHCSPNKIAIIRAALETIGITRTLLLRSSWSGGLHLYIPLPEPVSTFNLAVALKECLKAQGISLEAGQLEIFPNVKRWGNAAAKDFSEYNGHRLPLQPASGSCLLDEDFNPIGDSLERFFWLWDGAAAHQDVAALHQAMSVGRANHRKKPRRQLHITDSWRDDLEIEIAEGWTGHGQTNGLLKSIACYGVIFAQLQGDALEAYVLRIATTRPGYGQYCRHQADIHRRCKAWAKAASAYYWPLGSQGRRQGDVGSRPPLFNQQASEAAQERIKATVERLQELGQLPAQITARAHAIAKMGQLAMRTLYKYLTLWHPHHMQQGEIPEPEPNPAIEPDPQPPQPDRCDPDEIKEFPSSPKNMKGERLPAGEGGSDLPFITSDRGVRGDESPFPQAAEPENLYLLDDFARSCRRQLQRLGWSGGQLVQFIADRFGGKRRWQLSDDELISLLYQLQSEGDP